MAAQGEVIKSFLVGLGFDVDESSLRVFNSEIAKAAVRITALYTSVNAFAGAIVFAFSKISEGFEEMGYQYHIIAPAINKAIVLRQELMKAYGAAGINIRKTIVDSIKLNMSLTKTKYAIEAIYKSVGSKFFGLLTQQSDVFRKKLYDNMPRIIKGLETLVKTVFKAFEITLQLGERLWSILTRVYDFFVMLDKATDGWSTIILGLVAAWKLLNLSFLATPLGMVIAGLVAILALFDDFKTWQEGGDSLFDWTSFLPVIDSVSKELQLLKNVLDGIFTVIFNIGGAVVDVFQGKWFYALEHLKEAWGGVKQAAGGAWDAGAGVGSVGSAIGSWAGTNLGSTPSPHAGNMNANMQTQINISGSPNATQTAKATAMEQQNVNRDFARNMKGATR